MKKNIGIEVRNVPKKKCEDKHCPFHGSIVVRGRTFNGKVVKANMQKTVTIEWPRLMYLRKYER